MNDITERVERGAALLDEKRPGWWQQIDLDQLALETCGRCVLGQMARQLNPGVGPNMAYREGLALIDLKTQRGPEFGFDSYAEWEMDGLADDDRFAEIEAAADTEFAALTVAWRDLITSRRAAAEVTS